MIHVDDIRAKLKEVFGFDQFRGNQERIIMNILAGENTFVIMPTGAGKSMLMDALQFLQGQKLSTPQRDPELDTTVSVACDPRIQEILNKHLDDKQLSALTSSTPTEWTLTRTLSKSGRTKSCINQTPINNKQLQAIVSSCIRSHSQHAHLSFCQETQQRDTLDRYGQHHPYLQPVREAYLPSLKHI